MLRRQATTITLTMADVLALDDEPRPLKQPQTQSQTPSHVQTLASPKRHLDSSNITSSPFSTTPSLVAPTQGRRQTSRSLHHS
ncbi:hypothetical protein V1512DRAFT_245749 [Lipomyces arxii]|uniref:uncharacterized protein n=1 Tax=Lipomyces arxii TaxID=56418 RepID=UPI0034CE8B05